MTCKVNIGASNKKGAQHMSPRFFRMAKRGTPHHEYDFLEQIGTGTFGSVHRAVHKTSCQIVAIKVMKPKFRGSTDATNLCEYKTLRTLKHHANIVEHFDSYVGPEKELYFIMEFMDRGNLYQLIKTHREMGDRLSHDQIGIILRQILQAVAHLHQQGIFHRDLKPENLLIGSPRYINEGQDPSWPIIKLADFGLAREFKSRARHTEYVSTRWYRAPEVILRSTTYSYPVDLWAIGAIFAELITLRPLFPGQSEIDQLYHICNILGSPKAKPKLRHSTSGFNFKKLDAVQPQPVTSGPPGEDSRQEWTEGIKLAQKIGFEFPTISPQPLASNIYPASPAMLDLLAQFLLFEPSKRIKAPDALHHPFFQSLNNSIPNDLISKPTVPTHPSTNDNDTPNPPSHAPAVEPTHDGNLDQKRRGISWPRAKPGGGANFSSTVAQDIREAFGLAKGKTTTQRLGTKKPSLSSIRVFANVRAADMVCDPRTSQNKMNNTNDENDISAFDLPPIPLLSPIQVCPD